MEQIFWSDDAEIGKEYKETTWYRITPHFRDFIQKIRQKFNILGVILDEELNIGFIVEKREVEK